MLLEAAAPLLRDGRMTLEMIGDGPMLADLRRRRPQPALGAAVRFHGWLPHAAVQDVAADCTALTFPSIREFGGGVVLEAMAMGLAPVIVDYAGPGELVVGGHRLQGAARPPRRDRPRAPRDAGAAGRRSGRRRPGRCRGAARGSRRCSPGSGRPSRSPGSTTGCCGIAPGVVPSGAARPLAVTAAEALNLVIWPSVTPAAEPAVMLHPQARRRTPVQRRPKVVTRLRRGRGGLTHSWDRGHTSSGRCDEAGER